MINKITLTLLSSLPLFALAQTVEGKLEGYSEGDQVFFHYRNQTERVTDSTSLNADGTFRFSHALDEPTAATIVVGKNQSESRKSRAVTIYLEQNDVSISSKDSLKNFEVSGGTSNEELNNLRERQA